MNSLVAKPKVNNETQKWNIEMETSTGERVLLGYKIHGIFVIYEEFNTKEEAIKYIQKREDLKLGM